ncbi:MoaD/ThiS family protein [Burkholderia sp. MS455]|uniref:MoaD/ThiS family protein n=1 Tax=Burkholderia sp. MS455 TaxID=2811788 RepID=UPI00195DC837|nr:MoaD/ThiS family protein [Burkholderia sp. MS455]QRR07543.1 MoaD/ThiS family protein [Burkholderia sp. MS455]
MAKITVTLPSSMVNATLRVEASDLQQVFQHIQSTDNQTFNILFKKSEVGIQPKAFVALFVNDTQIFDTDTYLHDGDQVTFATAIAGG